MFHLDDGDLDVSVSYFFHHSLGFSTASGFFHLKLGKLK